MKSDIDQIVQEWVAYTAKLHPVTGEWRNLPRARLDKLDEPAQMLLDIVHSDSPTAFEFIAAVLEISDDEWVLANLGAGPIETLLYADPVGALERLRKLPSSPRLASALRNVYGFDLPPSVERAVISMAS